MVWLGYGLADKMTCGAHGQTILESAVQLAFDDQIVDDELPCEAVWKLAYSKSTEEACVIERNAIEKFGRSLGPQHWVMLELQKNLAWDMMAMGRLWRARSCFEP